MSVAVVVHAIATYVGAALFICGQELGNAERTLRIGSII